MALPSGWFSEGLPGGAQGSPNLGRNATERVYGEPALGSSDLTAQGEERTFFD